MRMSLWGRTVVTVGVLLALAGSARADAFYKNEFVSGKEGQHYTRGQVEKQVNWLTQLATMLRSVQGRKQIVYLSEGFDGRMIQGRDVRHSKGKETA